MLVIDIINHINTFAPLSLAEPWDNVGLMVGSSQWRASKIGVALDPDVHVLEEARGEKCDCLVVHHPLIFSPLKTIDLESPVSLVIQKALEYGIAVISVHTNWDKAREGVNVQLARPLLKESFLPLLPMENSEGLGAWGSLLKPCSLQNLMVKLRNDWNLSWVTGYGEPDRIVKTAALCGGSGGDLWTAALDKGADVYITADMKYHQILDACSLGMAICVVDHGEMERYSLAALCRLMALSNLPVVQLKDKGPNRLQIE